MVKQITPETVLSELRKHHTGRGQGVHVNALALALVGDNPSPADERNIRMAVTELRNQGEPICAHPNTGYFYAENTGEINQTCEFLYVRAMHSLGQIGQLKKRAVPELRGQLGLEV